MSLSWFKLDRKTLKALKLPVSMHTGHRICPFDKCVFQPTRSTRMGLSSTILQATPLIMLLRLFSCDPTDLNPPLCLQRPLCANFDRKTGTRFKQGVIAFFAENNLILLGIRHCSETPCLIAKENDSFY